MWWSLERRSAKASLSQLLLLEQSVLSKEYGWFEMPIFQMLPSKLPTVVSPDTTQVVVVCCAKYFNVGERRDPKGVSQSSL